MKTDTVHVHYSRTKHQRFEPNKISKEKARRELVTGVT
jgi:hypothetical protein